jgi:hypothetical protein
LRSLGEIQLLHTLDPAVEALEVYTVVEAVLYHRKTSDPLLPSTAVLQADPVVEALEVYTVVEEHSDHIVSNKFDKEEHLLPNNTSLHYHSRNIPLAFYDIKRFLLE